MPSKTFARPWSGRGRTDKPTPGSVPNQSRKVLPLAAHYQMSALSADSMNCAAWWVWVAWRFSLATKRGFVGGYWLPINQSMPLLTMICKGFALGATQ
jgi:hypothetical protein